MRYLSLILILAAFSIGACKNNEPATTKTEEPAPKPKSKAGKTLTPPIGAPKVNPADRRKAPEQQAEASAEKLDGSAPENGGIETKSTTKTVRPTIGENQFFGMYRSPCFGQCPIYNIDIDLQGHAVLEGKRFFDYIGFFEADFSAETMQQMIDLANKYGYFGFEHSYDANVTDVPSVLTILRSGDNVHWVYDRMGAPEGLHAFERDMEDIIKQQRWTKIEKNAGDQ
ncbi:MAG: DUF6438 domain-containing protein [Cryomorphaceae bacterium]